jgi:hypothetical protein
VREHLPPRSGNGDGGRFGTEIDVVSDCRKTLRGVREAKRKHGLGPAAPYEVRASAGAPPCYFATGLLEVEGEASGR